MSHPTHPPGFHPIRRDQLLQEKVHDSYKMKGKLAEPTFCPDCGAVFHDGRWQWLPKPLVAHQISCPACQRIRDHFPAGYVILTGGFISAHEQEIRQLILNHEAKEKSAHPLQRIMDIQNTDTGILITTTDVHLAQGIGSALHHAYQGELGLHFNPEQSLLRVNWER